MKFSLRQWAYKGSARMKTVCIYGQVSQNVGEYSRRCVWGSVYDGSVQVYVVVRYVGCRIRATTDIVNVFRAQTIVSCDQAVITFNCIMVMRLLWNSISGDFTDIMNVRK